jgi:hypothetical protein
MAPWALYAVPCDDCPLESVDIAGGVLTPFRFFEKVVRLRKEVVRAKRCHGGTQDRQPAVDRFPEITKEEGVHIPYPGGYGRRTAVHAEYLPVVAVGGTVAHAGSTCSSNVEQLESAIVEEFLNRAIARLTPVDLVKTGLKLDAYD